MAASEITNQLGSLFGEVGNLLKAKLSEQSATKAEQGLDTDAADAAILTALELSTQNARQLETLLIAISAGKLPVTAGDVHQSLERLAAKLFVESKLEDDRLVYGLTDAGHTYASEFKAALTDNEKATRDSSQGESGSALDFYREAAKLGPVMLDLAQTGTASQRADASQLLQDLRYQLHKIMAK